jgi:hypothetical protein
MVFFEQGLPAQTDGRFIIHDKAGLARFCDIIRPPENHRDNVSGAARLCGAVGTFHM